MSTDWRNEKKRKWRGSMFSTMTEIIRKLASAIILHCTDFGLGRHRLRDWCMVFGYAFMSLTPAVFLWISTAFLPYSQFPEKCMMKEPLGRVEGIRPLCIRSRVRILCTAKDDVGRFPTLWVRQKLDPGLVGSQIGYRTPGGEQKKKGGNSAASGSRMKKQYKEFPVLTIKISTRTFKIINII